MKKKFSKLLSTIYFLPSLLWWLGAPAFFGALMYAASVSFRLVYHLSPWWRFPVATPGASDSYLYLLWLGAVVERVPLGEFFYWLVPVFRSLWSLTGGAWSIPEFMLATTLLFIPFTVWITPWMIRRWVDIPVHRARQLSFGFLCVWILALGFRPGLYAWYAPFLFAGIGCLGVFHRAIDGRRHLMTAISAAAALLLTFLYPWFLGFAITFIAVDAWRTWIERRRSSAILAFVGATIVTAVIAVMIAPIFTRPSLEPLLHQYERTGVAFSHLPFITNTVLIIFGWLVLMFCFFRRNERSTSPFLTLWLCQLLLWFHYPFTGLFIFNEHFTSVIAVLGLISMASVLAENFDGQAQRPAPTRIDLWSFIPVILSSFFLLFFSVKSLLPHASIVQYETQILPWLPLFIAAWAVLHPSWRNRPVVYVSCFMIFGLWGYAAFLHGQWPLYPETMKYQPIIDWVRRDGSPQTTYCTDVESATVLGAHTGRRFYPSEGTIFERVTNEIYFSRLETIARAFDVKRSGQLPTWDYYTNFARLSSCNAFPWQEKTLQRLGVSSSTVDWLSGCRQDVIDQNLSRMHRAIDSIGERQTALPEICRRVIVSDALAEDWHLPTSTHRLDRVPGFTIWSAK